MGATQPNMCIVLSGMRKAAEHKCKIHCKACFVHTLLSQKGGLKAPTNRPENRPNQDIVCLQPNLVYAIWGQYNQLCASFGHSHPSKALKHECKFQGKACRAQMFVSRGV